MAYQSELKVITAAKVPAGYVMTVTQKSPKQFRFSPVAKLQTYAPYTVENLYKANGHPTCCRWFRLPGGNGRYAAGALSDGSFGNFGCGVNYGGTMIFNKGVNPHETNCSNL